MCPTERVGRDVETEAEMAGVAEGNRPLLRLSESDPHSIAAFVVVRGTIAEASGLMDFHPLGWCADEFDAGRTVVTPVEFGSDLIDDRFARLFLSAAVVDVTGRDVGCEAFPHECGWFASGGREGNETVERDQIGRPRGLFVGQHDLLLGGFEHGGLFFVVERLLAPHAEPGGVVSIEVQEIKWMFVVGQRLAVGVFAGEERGSLAHFARSFFKFARRAIGRGEDEASDDTATKSLRHGDGRAFVNRDAAAEGELHPLRRR